MTDQPEAQAEPHPAEVLRDWFESDRRNLTDHERDQLKRLLDIEAAKDTRIDELDTDLFIRTRQRDYLGGAVSHWIARAFGAKVAAGDMAPAALPIIVRREVENLERDLGGIAEQGMVVSD